MNHAFDIEHARLYGIAEAVIISNLQFWIMRNKANGENKREGRTWTYNSVKAFSELFPYMTENQIRRSLEKLVSAEVLIAGNFNDVAYDRTKWFAFSDESIFLSTQIHLANLPNGSGKRAKTVNTDINKDKKPDGSAARASRLPKDWTLLKSWGKEAMTLQSDWTAEHVRFEADKFRDYWISKAGRDATKTDWLATWRNWVRNAGPMPVAKTGAGAAWWTSPESKMAKALEVGVGEPLRGETAKAWEGRIEDAIANGGKPRVKAPMPTVQMRETVAQIDADKSGPKKLSDAALQGLQAVRGITKKTGT